MAKILRVHWDMIEKIVNQPLIKLVVIKILKIKLSIT